MNCINLQPESKDARRRRLKLARHKRWRGRNLESERARVRQWKSQNSKSVSAYNKLYRAGHLEELSERAATYRSAHRDSLLLRRRAAYAADPEKYRADALRWQAANKDKVKSMYRRWCDANPEAVRANARNRRARKAGAKGSCSVEQLKARVSLYGGLCWVPGCGKTYEAIDHVIPLAKGGSNWPSNLRPICNRHNSVKGSKMPNHFLKKAA